MTPTPTTIAFPDASTFFRTLSTLYDTLRSQAFLQEEAAVAPTERSLDLLADNILSEVINKSGMKRSLTGTTYLVAAVKTILADRRVLTGGVTKALYPALAARFGKNPASIERAIRNALQLCYGSGSSELNRYFGTSVFTPSRCPTNAEFITLLVDHILLQARNRL